VHVSGAVDFDGAPVPYGRIQFVPEAGGPPGWAVIKDGKFDTAGEGGNATLGGAHKATVEGYSQAPDPARDSGSAPLFSGYITSVDLGESASTQNIDVPKNAGPKTRKK